MIPIKILFRFQPLKNGLLKIGDLRGIKRKNLKLQRQRVFKPKNIKIFGNRNVPFVLDEIINPERTLFVVLVIKPKSIASAVPGLVRFDIARVVNLVTKFACSIGSIFFMQVIFHG